MILQESINLLPRVIDTVKLMLFDYLAPRTYWHYQISIIIVRATKLK